MAARAARSSPRLLLAVWAGLLVLLGLTLFVSLFRIGLWNPVLNLAIAAAKAGLILWFFMHVGRERPLVRLAAGAGLFWLAILFALGFNDWTTRDRAAGPVRGATWACINVPQGGPRQGWGKPVPEAAGADLQDCRSE